MEPMQSLPAAFLTALPELPEHSHNTFNVKMPKQHPLADVIVAAAKFALYAVAGAITFMYAKHKIDTGSPFEPIQTALNVIRDLNK
jgi:hypothetical protein